MAFLRGFGCAVPPRVVGNDALAARTGKEAASIEKNTGMRERRYADEGVGVVDLGLAAAQDCLAKADVSAEDVGLILFSCGSTERAFPGPASTLAARLGMPRKARLDRCAIEHQLTAVEFPVSGECVKQLLSPMCLYGLLQRRELRFS